MLHSLTIRDFALIASVHLEFGSGFTVLLGETGAGKSIVIDALAAALGDRMPADSLRTGAKKAVVEATFSLEPNHHIGTILEENALDWATPELIARRDLSASGTSRCFVNDTPTTVAVVRELASYLMDFHGQHDTHGLLHPRRHRELLDIAGNHGALLQRMKEGWSTLVDARKRLADLEQQAETAIQVREQAEYIVRTISSVQPHVGELEQVLADLERSEHHEQIYASANMARSALTESEQSAFAQLQVAVSSLRSLSKYSPNVESIIPELESAITTCKEASLLLSPLADEEHFSPEHIEHLRQRLSELQRLARKYGSVEMALAARQEAEQQILTLENVDYLIAQAREQVTVSAEAAMGIALEIRDRRLTVADNLEETITAALREMGMNAAVASIRVEPAALAEHGADDVEFLLSANAGEEPRPLQKVASGGELSRFMLALKSALAASSSLGTMVFDEIDTGISGRVARHVGHVIRRLSETTQVLCITHLPQIASLANQMIRVEKIEREGTTTVVTTPVTGEESVIEVARLLSGATVTEAALDSARELMNEVTALRAG